MLRPPNALRPSSLVANSTSRRTSSTTHSTPESSMNQGGMPPTTGPQAGPGCQGSAASRLCLSVDCGTKRRGLLSSRLVWKVAPLGKQLAKWTALRLSQNTYKARRFYRRHPSLALIREYTILFTHCPTSSPPIHRTNQHSHPQRSLNLIAQSTYDDDPGTPLLQTRSHS